MSTRGFRLPQRLHLRTLKNRENVVKKSEKHLIKIGKPGNFEEVHFFPVSPSVF